MNHKLLRETLMILLSVMDLGNLKKKYATFKFSLKIGSNFDKRYLLDND